MKRVKSRILAKEKVEFSVKLLLFPENYEKIFGGIYLVLLPYILGTLFLFFYIADASIDTISTLDKNFSYLLNWYIGYEVLAMCMLLLIIKSLFNLNKKSFDSATKQEV